MHASSRQEEPEPGSPEFANFFRENYRGLVRAAMHAGASGFDADDAAADTMEEVLVRWDHIRNPPTYARKAVVTNYIKAKKKSLDRIRNRQVERGCGTAHGGEDNALTGLEIEQLKKAMLDSLTEHQRTVMSQVFSGHLPSEISEMLEISPGAVRQAIAAARRKLKQFMENLEADERTPKRRITSIARKVR